MVKIRGRLCCYQGILEDRMEKGNGLNEGGWAKEENKGRRGRYTGRVGWCPLRSPVTAALRNPLTQSRESWCWLSRADRTAVCAEGSFI